MPSGRLGRRLHELVDCTYAGVVSQVGVATGEFVACTYAGVVSQVGVAIGEPFEGIGVKAVAGIGGKVVRRRRGSCVAAGFFVMIGEVAMPVCRPRWSQPSWPAQSQSMSLTSLLVPCLNQSLSLSLKRFYYLNQTKMGPPKKLVRRNYSIFTESEAQDLCAAAAAGHLMFKTCTEDQTVDLTNKGMTKDSPRFSPWFHSAWRTTGLIL